MIRSNADPSVDMYNVDNPMSLVGYLGRDQYGDFRSCMVRLFNAQPADFAESSMKYEKGKDKYIEIGRTLNTFTCHRTKWFSLECGTPAMTRNMLTITLISWVLEK